MAHKYNPITQSHYRFLQHFFRQNVLNHTFSWLRKWYETSTKKHKNAKHTENKLENSQHESYHNKTMNESEPDVNNNDINTPTMITKPSKKGKDRIQTNRGMFASENRA